jgi:hypothetical protein
MTVRPLTVADREAIVGFELAHLGMAERPPGSNNTDPGAWYGTNGMAWCAAFQSWSFTKTLGFCPFPASSSRGFAACVEGAKWFRRQGQWAPANVRPERGWLVFFIWTPGDIEHHIGLVLSAAGPRDISTVEGNTSDKVQLHNRRGSTIAGYGVINYAGVVAAAAPAAPPLITRSLHQGASGEDVARLQNLLTWNAAKHGRVDFNPGAVDGDYGSKTRNAVWAFKRFSNSMADMARSPRPFSQITDTVGPVTFGLLTWWGSV